MSKFIPAKSANREVIMQLKRKAYAQKEKEEKARELLKEKIQGENK